MSPTVSLVCVAILIGASACADGDAEHEHAAVDGTGGSIGTGGAPGGTGGAASFMPGSATFSAIYAEIIVGKGCTGSPLCHAGPGGGLNLSQRQAAYDALYDKPAMGVTLTPPNCRDSGLKRVVPNDPQQSLLMMKVEAKQPCGSMMPPNPPALDADSVTRIREWIAKGAPND